MFRFAFLKTEKLKFNDLDSDPLVLRAHLQQRIITNNVALFLLLHDRKTDQNIFVACAHLFWNPEFSDGTGVFNTSPFTITVKVLQAKFLMNRMQLFAKHNSVTNIVLCGDFNSTPDSSVYKLLRDKILPNTDPQIRALPYSPLPFAHGFTLAILFITIVALTWRAYMSI